MKQRLPAHWPEMARDIFAGSISAMTSTTLLFPLDTLKTRWQVCLLDCAACAPAPALTRSRTLAQRTATRSDTPSDDDSCWQTGQPSPKNPREMYRGFAPAVSYSAFGMALWVVSRNALERTIPDYEGPMQHWKHFVCGGIAGLCVQLPTFPFDTLKKRLQSAQVARGVLGEVRGAPQRGASCVYDEGRPLFQQAMGTSMGSFRWPCDMLTRACARRCVNCCVRVGQCASTAASGSSRSRALIEPVVAPVPCTR